MDRRVVLKGMALGGMAGVTMAGPLRALAGEPAASVGATGREPLLVLTDEGTAGSDFLQGAMAATGSQLQVQKPGLDLASLLEFERQLREARRNNKGPLRVIGLLDDASATLVVDLARSAGARVQWLAQHADGEGFQSLGQRLAAPDRPGTGSVPVQPAATALNSHLVSLSILAHGV